MWLKVVFPIEAKVQITNSREPNVDGALNVSEQTPDCNGKFEKIAGICINIIQIDNIVLNTT